RMVADARYVDVYLVTKNQPFTLTQYNNYFNNGGNNGGNDNVNTLQGKSALFVGDSICYGQWDNEPRQGWAGRIATQYGMTVTNTGIGGTTFSTIRPNRIVTQLHNTQNNSYDYVILQGGTNDGWGDMAETGTTPAKVGVMTNSFNVSDFDISTFGGGLEELLYYAFKYFPNAKIGFMTTFATPLAANQNLGATGDMSAYYNLALDICKKWGVPVLDMYHDRYVNNELMQVTTYNCLKDALHPNAKGYDNLAPYIGEWMERLVDNTTYKTNPYKNQRALFVGDSISYGHYDTPQGYSWAGRLADSIGILSDNQSQSGWAVSNIRGSQIVHQLEANKNKQYDYVIMQGGINDAWGAIDPPGSVPAAVGTITNSYNPKDFDISTYAGALEQLFYNAYQLFPNARLGYLINFALPASSFDMRNYHDIAIEICNKWKVSYYDMHTDSALAAALDAGSLTNMADTVHPNKNGYDIITPYIEKWFKTVEYADISSFESKMPSLNEANAVEPYKKNGVLYVNDCDSLNGWSGDYGTNVTLSTDSPTQGKGAVSLSGGDNTKINDTQYIGGMAYLEFTSSADLSGYDTIAFDYYISKSMLGKVGQLQLNFATTGADGYNTLFNINGLSAGWHSVSVSSNLDSFKATTFDWSQINKLRFTWWNINNSISDGMTIKIDNIRMYNQAEMDARNGAIANVINAIDSIGTVTETNFKKKLSSIESAEAMVENLEKTYGEDISSEVTTMVTLVRAREQYNYFASLPPVQIL
ncbi:MAG: SGNH/GDSL hydrolase family protein, partial [Clostridia bacterium]|nr:SGNH/GDSL hydrolase family protein [Clostridia bacterium]